jgi:hypothetical protein
MPLEGLTHHPDYNTTPNTNHHRSRHNKEARSTGVMALFFVTSGVTAATTLSSSIREDNDDGNCSDNWHCSAPIAHRCRHPSQATAQHQGDHLHRPAVGLTNHPDHNTTPNTASSLTAQQRNAGKTAATATTDIAPLRSRIAAGVRHKPSRNIKVTLRRCNQKGCTAILITAPPPSTEQWLTIQKRNIETTAATATTRTDIAPLRSHVAAGVRHKPSCNIKATIGTCIQKSCITNLITTRHQAQNIIAQGTARKHRDDGSNNDNSHRPAPIAHRCRRPSQAIAQHQGDRGHMPPEGLYCHTDDNVTPSTKHHRSRRNMEA